MKTPGAVRAQSRTAPEAGAKDQNGEGGKAVAGE